MFQPTIHLKNIPTLYTSLKKFQPSIRLKSVSTLYPSKKQIPEKLLSLWANYEKDDFLRDKLLLKEEITQDKF